MQETSSTIMLVSFAITVLTTIFNPTGTVASALTNLGTRLAGKFNGLLTTFSPTDAVDTLIAMGSVTNLFI